MFFVTVGEPDKFFIDDVGVKTVDRVDVQPGHIVLELWTIYKFIMTVEEIEMSVVIRFEFT